MKKFTHESLYDIMIYLQEALTSCQEGQSVMFEVLNPDVCDSTYSGEELTINDTKHIYRSYHTWSDLAHTLNCKFLTPQIVDKYCVQLHFKKLNTQNSFHNKKKSIENKYGVESEFSKIDKNEQSSFLSSYMQALNLAKLSKRVRILSLGVNRADEFALILKMLCCVSHIDFVGIDYCQSAVKEAKKRFPFENMHFYAHDINDLESLQLGSFDLIISIGTLQSSSINFKVVFMDLVQRYLKKQGAFILGFPNCRWRDGEMMYGAKIPNYSFSDMTLLIKDIYFCKKYLQQKRYKVYLSGKEYIFLTAVKPS